MSEQRAVIIITSTTLLKKNLAKSTYYIAVLIEGLFGRTQPSSGQTVSWNFHYEFVCFPHAIIRFRVVKKGLLGSDVEAGEGVVPMSEAYVQGGLTGTVDLHHKGDTIGNLNYQIQFMQFVPQYQPIVVPLSPLVQPMYVPVGNYEKGFVQPPPQVTSVINRTMGVGDIQFLSEIYRTADGSGEVHNCRLLPTSQPAIVKITHCHSSEKFNSVQKEGLIMCRMTHANVCRFYESLLDNREGRLDHWLVMEYIDGVNLAAEIARRGQGRQYWSDEELKRHISELIDAFAYMQSEGICHSDVKSDNIVLSATGTLKIIDFGLSLACNDAKFQGTATYRVGGTPNFFSPLQFEAFKAYKEGRNPQSLVQHNPYKSDVYALGLVFLSMSTLRFIDGLSDGNRRDLQQILTAEIAQIHSGNWLKDILASMLVVDERDRADFTILKKLGYASSR